MKPTLLYHGSPAGSDSSPFDKAIREIASGDDLILASPYMSLGYIEKILLPEREWRCITDLQELIAATPPNQLSKMADWLLEYSERVRHFDRLHAKFVLSNLGGYLGSANLTFSGLLRRTELGVLIEDQEQLVELRNWFAMVWKRTSVLDESTVTALVRARAASAQKLARPILAPSRVSDAPKPAEVESSTQIGQRGSEETLADFLWEVVRHLVDSHQETASQASKAGRLLWRLPSNLPFLQLGELTSAVGQGQWLLSGAIPTTLQDFLNPLLSPAPVLLRRRSKGRWVVISRISEADERDAQHLQRELKLQENVDRVLEFVINRMSFTHHKLLPELQELESFFLDASNDFLDYEDELLEAGLVQESSLGFRLNPAFRWTVGRQSFERAYSAWNRKASAEQVEVNRQLEPNRFDPASISLMAWGDKEVRHFFRDRADAAGWVDLASCVRELEGAFPEILRRPFDISGALERFVESATISSPRAVDLAVSPFVQERTAGRFLFKEDPESEKALAAALVRLMDAFIEHYRGDEDTSFLGEETSPESGGYDLPYLYEVLHQVRLVTLKNRRVQIKGGWRKGKAVDFNLLRLPNKDLLGRVLSDIQPIDEIVLRRNPFVIVRRPRTPAPANAATDGTTASEPG